MSSIKYHPEIEKLEHDDASAPETKRVLAYGWDASGLQKVKLNVDANGKLNVNSTASLAGTTLPISGATEGVGVAILDGSGNQITSFGGGTQYTEGDTDATLTGTISMAEGPSNTVTPLQVDASKHLQVDIAAASTDITVQDGGGSVTVDNNGTFAVQASLNAGTNAIGKLAANSGVDIGDTDVTSIVPGTGATNLGKAEDGAHTSGDVGVMDLGVRNDTMADFTGADNDYTPKSVTLKGQTLTANAPRGRKLHQITTITSSTSETTVLTAAASTYHDVYGIIVTNTSSTATEVSFKDATAGTTRFTISAPANDTRGFMVPVDAAVVQSATNNNWTATCADSVASIIVTVLAVKNL